MNPSIIESLKELRKALDLNKALEAGSYDTAPSNLTQGAALQVENLEPVMAVVTAEKEHLKLQKIIDVDPCKSTTAQFNRQLSTGSFGGSAQLEGEVGPEETSDFVRITVPMCFYSKLRRVTLASTMVETVDGKPSDERAAEDAALNIASDIEFDCFRGLDDFSNGGVFDGHPAAVPRLPNMQGLFLQVKQSDFQANARDAMFAEYGSDETVVLSMGGLVMTQDRVEDLCLRSTLNFGNAERLIMSPVALSQYNRIAFNKERIILAGSPQNATGADLRTQWVSGGTCSFEASQFLRGKKKPRRLNRPNLPAAPTIAGAAAPNGSLLAGDYVYYVTSENERGEGTPSAAITVAGVTLGQRVNITITHPGSTTFRFFNVYRGSSQATAEFIGRVIATPNSATTLFVDLGNKAPGSSTAVLIEKGTFKFKELAPYSRAKLAVNDLTTPEAHFRFLTLAVFKPRANPILTNIRDSI